MLKSYKCYDNDSDMHQRSQQITAHQLDFQFSVRHHFCEGSCDTHAQQLRRQLRHDYKHVFALTLIKFVSSCHGTLTAQTSTRQCPFDLLGLALLGLNCEGIKTLHSSSFGSFGVASKLAKPDRATSRNAMTPPAASWSPF